MVAPKAPETKHDRFIRLMQARLEKAWEALRLVSQLASPNYENTPEEAEEVIRVLDERVRHIAQTFDVEYATRIGKAASQTTGGAKPIGSLGRQVSILDEIAIVKALELLRKGETEQVEQILRSAITGSGKAA